MKIQRLPVGGARFWPGGLTLMAASLAGFTAAAGTLDTIGLTLLSTVATNLNGGGVRVAQIEAAYPSAGYFEVNPAVPLLPARRFVYYSTSGSATSFPNSVGSESEHADDVAKSFYGPTLGVATNVLQVLNYDAAAFVTATGLPGNYVVGLAVGNLSTPVVNQSFVLTLTTTNEQKSADTAYDNYAAAYDTLFVSAVGNGGAVNAPSTCYNGIGVGAYGGSSSTGPTPDNGRAKPDLVAPAGETSFACPLVAGAAAVLIQAGARGVGGADTKSATNMTTLKALLLNGAIKPSGWTNASSSPLDVNYGAGVLNVFESYSQLAGGKRGYIAAAPVTTGAAHPPTGATGTITNLSGWDYNTNTSSLTTDGVNHYYFNVTNGMAGATFTATATLVWNRHQNQSTINNLALYLYSTAGSNLVAASRSKVDNVQHLWVPRLPAGRYDLQVWKAGGSGTVSTAEPYALAFEFVAAPLSLTGTATNLTCAWPVYPAGFRLASTTNLAPPLSLWNTNYPAPTVSHGFNQISLPATNGTLFFNLIRP